MDCLLRPSHTWGYYQDQLVTLDIHYSFVVLPRWDAKGLARNITESLSHYGEFVLFGIYILIALWAT